MDVGYQQSNGGACGAQPQGAVETSAKLENQHSLEQRSRKHKDRIHVANIHRNSSRTSYSKTRLSLRHALCLTEALIRTPLLTPAALDDTTSQLYTLILHITHHVFNSDHEAKSGAIALRRTYNSSSTLVSPLDTTKVTATARKG